MLATCVFTLWLTKPVLLRKLPLILHATHQAPNSWALRCSVLSYLNGGTCVPNWGAGLVFLRVTCALLQMSEWMVVILAAVVGDL